MASRTEAAAQARAQVHDAAERQVSLSRRSLIRDAFMLAVGVASGATLVGCGGGGGDGDPGGGAGDSNDALVEAAMAAGAPFAHGVASGDPLQDRVMLWTRASLPAPGVVNVTWEMALDANFGAIVKQGSAATGPEQDYTVKVDATGLQPGTIYYYRFAVGTSFSNKGRTRTLPADEIDRLRLGVFSCANFPAGYFNAYAHAARRGDIDYALHLGDYIYEYGVLGYASQLAIAFDRVSEPSHETLTLGDYRRRHAQYKSDPDLRAFHATLPVIAVWDDHDIADNSWQRGAGNHSDGEGVFEERRAAAIQAFHEWLPTRLPDPANPQKIYRSFSFGKLASLHMLDTRLAGRDQQQSLAEYVDGRAQGTDRQLLGVEQSAWLTRQMEASQATWEVLGQQVLMARMEVPLTVASTFDLFTLTEYLLAKATPEGLRSDSQRALVQQRRAPYNLDAWDGYPSARESVLAVAKSRNKNLISLAGDTHNAWASDLTDATGAHVGVEFATASVSSPGFERLLPLISSVILEDAFPEMVPDLRYAQTSERGYLVVTLTPTEARGDWIEVSTVLTRDYGAKVAMSLRAGVGERRVVAV